MRSFQGAVLFVDMLGFSALTRGTLSLGIDECKPWKVDSHGNFPHQLLAAKILLAFRNVLVKTKEKFPDVRVAQLSDCAFLWSANVGVVGDAGRHLMHEAALKGLLCRGGFSIGDIHEPEKVNRSLGAFIVGDAVTRAATYETAGKGMRIFTDQDAAHGLLAIRPNEVFHQFINPLTGEIVDEWQWYAPSQSMCAQQDKAGLRQKIDRLVGCYATLRYSPKLAWSATTPEGRRQIACSVVTLSEAIDKLDGNSGRYRLSIEHLLPALDNGGRSDRTCKKIREQFVSELIAPNQAVLRGRKR
ncbi:hypothetical protein [Burkholderia latens]|uniref:hypothetical protein n=1 Tax=Burkholderia latens TaxID=488446 RepID=UPI000AA27685|nr:hypothetical protein [Burkholderia latens]